MEIDAETFILDGIDITDDEASPLHGGVDRNMFVAVEKKPPYAVSIHVLSDDYLKYARERVQHTLHVIKQAEAVQDYPTGWPDLNIVQLPTWLADAPSDDDFNN